MSKHEAIWQETDRLEAILKAKDADYGQSFARQLEKRGLLSVVIRLEDKVNRLDTLVEQESQVDESIEDTLQDIAGYAVMTLVEMRGRRSNDT